MPVRSVGVRVAAVAVALTTAFGASAAVAQTPAAPGGPRTLAAAGADLPALALVARRTDGGMNLFRMPLVDGSPDQGRPALLASLPASAGFRFDRAQVLAGDFGTLTPGDDGGADFVIWHALADGSVRVWGIGGGSDPHPRLWYSLPPPWSWANSRPLVADVNGDDLDDLLVLHRGSTYRDRTRIWVLLSNGHGLAAPVGLPITSWSDWQSSRYFVGDLDDDGEADLLSAERWGGDEGEELVYTAVWDLLHGGLADGRVWLDYFHGLETHGWSVRFSRQMAGHLNGDGHEDVATIHRAGDGGVVVWVHAGCGQAMYYSDCVSEPSRWQVLHAADGWSFANSRQYLADTSPDGYDDLVSVHRSSTGGVLVWRAPDLGSRFGAPQLVAQLRPEQGWRWASMRESAVTH